jgi:hypothetical protein
VTNLSTLSPFYRISDADIVAADVALDKIAYGSDGKVIGSLVTGASYTPAMMQYSGTTAYYRDTTTTVTGNKFTALVRFTDVPKTGATRYIMWVDGSSYVRCSLFINGSDHANTDYRNTVQFRVSSSTDTEVMRLISPNDLLDGNQHTIFASFDGDSGLATFYIDGVDADDTGNASRVGPAAGTLDTGTGKVYIGSVSTGNYWQGQLGYVGYRDAYLTNWSDFMDTNGPKALDEAGWTEWGGQPLFWNEHGDMDNNLGSSGAFTKTGTINVGKGGN